MSRSAQEACFLSSQNTNVSSKWPSSSQSAFKESGVALRERHATPVSSKYTLAVYLSINVCVKVECLIGFLEPFLSQKLLDGRLRRSDFQCTSLPRQCVNTKTTRELTMAIQFFLLDVLD